MESRAEICSVRMLKERKAIKFAYEQEGIKREGLVVAVGNEVRAFENRCKHIPLPLDYGDGRFFTGDGKYLVCQNHGAMYEPLTGRCERGPCEGANLTAIEVSVEGDKVFVAGMGVENVRLI